MAKKKVKKSKSKKIDSDKKKVNIVLRDLAFFAIFFIISMILYSITEKPFYENLFFMLSLIFGFIILAFLISLLVLIFLRVLK